MSQEPRIIKKYSNRRLYDTEQSCYITLDDVRDLVCDSVLFRVENVKDGEDITRSILLQIILDQEVMQVPMFSESSLRYIIMFYGSAMQNSLGAFLDQTMPMLVKMQKEMAGKPDFSGMDNRLWSELAIMQGRMLSSVFQDFMNRSMDVYSNAQKQFSEGAEQMMKLSDMAFPFVPPSKKGGKGSGKKS